MVSIGTERSMTDCNHEEADTRIVVHVVHAIQDPNVSSVLVRTVDTDVVVILVGKLNLFRDINPGVNLWVAFGMGRNFSLISINSIGDFLCEARSVSLPVFHALTGCDTTSTFYGKGKKSAWQAWVQYPNVTPTFKFLANNPFHQLTVDSSHFQQIERFAVIMYDKLSPSSSINRTRMDLFCKSNRDMDKLPPTQVYSPAVFYLFLLSNNSLCSLILGGKLLNKLVFAGQ